MIRNGNGIMISINSSDDYLKNIIKAYLIENINDLKSIIFNEKVIYGENYIEKKIDDYTFKLSAESFFQVNDNMTNKLYDKVIEHIKDDNVKTILDLYCGVGTITSKLSKYAEKVIGIESSKEAVANAIENAKLNNINNINFIEGKVENELDKLLDENIDIIVVDPPRTGLDKNALNSIIKINSKKMIYVSCDPVTLARDLKLLSDNYDIEDITPFDMFPNTSHVETVVLMSIAVK
jgi:23S rRNA (uracil1939-C5)-methyltransferase